MPIVQTKTQGFDRLATETKPRENIFRHGAYFFGTPQDGCQPSIDNKREKTLSQVVNT